LLEDRWFLWREEFFGPVRVYLDQSKRCTVSLYYPDNLSPSYYGTCRVIDGVQIQLKFFSGHEYNLNAVYEFDQPVGSFSE